MLGLFFFLLFVSLIILPKTLNQKQKTNLDSYLLFKKNPFFFFRIDFGFIVTVFVFYIDTPTEEESSVYGVLTFKVLIKKKIFHFLLLLLVLFFFCCCCCSSISCSN